MDDYEYAPCDEYCDRCAHAECICDESCQECREYGYSVLCSECGLDREVERAY